MRLLIVEDDAMLADGLTRSLRRAGHTVDWVESAERAWLAVRSEHFDIMILDVGLPGADGFSLLRRLRGHQSDVAVIVATAREAVPDRVHGLDLGGDDYLVKPFAFEELEARVRALMRRRAARSAPAVTVGNLVVDLTSREARVDEERLELTPREWAILELLVTHAGVPLAKERIVQSLSSWDDTLSANAIEVYVSRLRGKVEPAGAKIRTIRGYGYVLERQGGK